MPSPRARFCRPRCGWPVFEGRGPIAAETLQPADPDLELWDLGHEAVRPRPVSGSRRRPPLCPGGHHRRGRPIPGCWNSNWSNPRWVGGSSTTPRGSQATEFASASSQPSSARPRPALASTPIAPRWPRCRPPHRDVHGDQCRGHAGEELHRADQALRDHQPPGPRRSHRPRCRTAAVRSRARPAAPGRPPERRVHVHQGGDLDL